MTNIRNIFLALALFSLAQAFPVTTNFSSVAIPVFHVIPARSISADHAPPTPFLDVSVLTITPDSQEKIVLAAIATNSSIVGAPCEFGDAYTCVGAAITGIISTLFLAFKTVDLGGSILPLTTRSPGSMLTLTQPQWQPTETCSLACQLKGGVEPDSWTHFANVTIDGATLTMHFSRSGSINGIRAFHAGDAVVKGAKREDADDTNGLVATYFWEDGNENAWSSFDTEDQKVDIESGIEKYIQSGNNVVLTCNVLEDAAGNADAGLMVIGVNNDDELAQSGLISPLDQCPGITG